MILCSTARLIIADIVHLKKGSSIEGKIIKQTREYVVLKIEMGTITIPQETIAQIEYKPWKSSKDNKKKPTETIEPQAVKKKDQEIPPEIKKKVDELIIQFKNNVITRDLLEDELIKIKNQALPYLINIVKMKKRPLPLETIINLLAKCAGKEATPVLVKLLEHKDQSVRLATMTELGNSSDIRGIEPLLNLLEDPDPAITSKALMTLALLTKQTSSMHWLLELISQKINRADPGQKIQLIRVLELLKENAFIPLLISLLNDPDARVKKCAVRALGEINKRAEDIVDNLTPLLRSEDDDLVKQVCITLGKIKDPACVPDLIETLKMKEENGAVISTAVWALRKISGLGFPPNPDRWERWWISESRKFEQRFEILQSQLQSENDSDVIAAIKELGSLLLWRDEVAESLIPLLWHDNPQVRLKTCDALRSLNSSIAIEDLITCLEDSDQKVAKAAWSALKTISGRNFPLDFEKWQTWYEIRSKD
jgi:HEAT repeat protein